MATDSKVAPIPTDINEFIEFFAERLGDLQFPDIDMERLGALAGQVRERAAEVARLSEQVRVAREGLDQAQDELRKSARRGLAYARVYAEDDRELSEQLDGLELGKEQGADQPARKRRGRKPKADKEAGKESAEWAGKEPTGELPFTGKKPKLVEVA
jgi:hypothetical protein